MLKRLVVVCLMFALLCPMFTVALAAEVAPTADAVAMPTIVVSSTSIKEGKWLTAIANNKNNKPSGGNKSPQLSWPKVEGAKYYAVVMFDETANWLHWYKKDVAAKSTEMMTLKLGAFTKKSVYVGPYPPSGTHTYKVEVFALKQAPDAFTVKMNNTNNYDTIVSGLDKAKKEAGNILARGAITATYARGDNTKK